MMTLAAAVASVVEGGRHRRHHGEQRSGVPTVVEDRMDPTHPTCPMPPRLAALRRLVPKVLVSKVHEPVILRLLLPVCPPSPPPVKDYEKFWRHIVGANLK